MTGSRCARRLECLMEGRFANLPHPRAHIARVLSNAQLVLPKQGVQLEVPAEASPQIAQTTTHTGIRRWWHRDAEVDRS